MNGKKWNGIQYDLNKKKICEIKNGRGFFKEYDKNGELIFEGDYLNGERNGKGNEYNDKSVLIFEGEFSRGRRWKGKVRKFRENELIFEGDYLNEEKNGYG